MKSRLLRRYATLQKQLASIGSISQGSVAFQAPNSWRWTFKIKGKTACVALSEEQAAQMRVSGLDCSTVSTACACCKAAAALGLADSSTAGTDDVDDGDIGSGIAGTWLEAAGVVLG